MWHCKGSLEIASFLVAAGIYQHWQVAGAPVGASFQMTISPTLKEGLSPVPLGTSTTPSRTDLALVLLLFLALIID